MLNAVLWVVHAAAGWIAFNVIYLLLRKQVLAQWCLEYGLSART